MEKSRSFAKRLINWTVLNNFIERLSGVRITKSDYLQEVRSYKRNYRPLHVEFVGVSGAGKTTLFQEIKRLRGGKSSWLSPKEFKNSLLEMLYSKELPENYSHILGLKIEDILSREYRPEDSLAVLCYFKSNLFENYWVAKNNKDATVIFEDGLFHNFGQVLLRHREEDAGLIQTFLKNRVMIYCKASEQTLTTHILQRKAENIIRPQHKNKSVEELTAQQHLKIEGREKFVAWMKRLHVPTLTVDTKNSANENAHLVMRFIKEQQLSKSPLWIPQNH